MCIKFYGKQHMLLHLLIFRRHTNVIMLNLLLLLYYSPPIDEGNFKCTEYVIWSDGILTSFRPQLTEEILKRFLPGVDEDEATWHLFSTFEGSKQAYSPFLIDWLHYHKSEATVSNLSSSALSYVGSALEAVGSVGSALLGKWTQ